MKKATVRSKQKARRSNKIVTVKFSNFRRRGVAFSILFGLVGAYLVFQSFAAPPKNGNLTGPLTITQRWQSTINNPTALSTQGCFGIDDSASWAGSGTLAPGQSYTFTPQYPICSSSESPVIAMNIYWSGNTDVKLETTNPFLSGYSNTKIIDLHEIAPISTAQGGKKQAHLCILADASRTYAYLGYPVKTSEGLWSHPISWSMTMTNTGSQTASVSARGYQENGWASNIFPGCLRADADNDHWNDSLEMITQSLAYYAFPDQNSPIMFKGSNDASLSPADINGDKIINGTDVAMVHEHIGEGSAVTLDQISPNNGTSWFYNETRQWRRYDIDGDGRVTLHDEDWVSALIGKPIPLQDDPLAPWAVINLSDTVPTNYSSYSIPVYGMDNDMITHVDVYVTYGGKKRLLCQNWGEGTSPGPPPTTNMNHFSCGWQTPRQSGVKALIEAVVYDNAGHTYTASKTVTVQ